MVNNEDNFYKRMEEIGEYTFQNRMDTVFVYQLIFISLLIIIGLLYLKSIGVITPFFLYPTIILITIIVIFILINRIVFTDKIRNKNHWYQLNFGDGNIKPSDYVSAGSLNGTKGLMPGLSNQSNGCPANQHPSSGCVAN